ncbi:MAG: DNA Methylase [Cenarchaeum symbiont of Oopsacas minuta]|nr:DNA Methylase [Cenarchaeum symbiont of Oopsacas minuta]
MAEPNWSNRTLFHGDNLDFLRAMNSNTVDLITTDPPFNKGKDFHATPDSLAKGASFQDRWVWEKDVHEEWVDQITDDHPHVMNVIQGSRSSYGDDMGAFLCFMGVRLLAMKRVLKNTGSIYLHCDPTASHYLKELMDSIFGRKNFRNEIIWSYQRWTGATKHFQRMHDVLLFYGKSNNIIFNMLKEPYSEKSKHKSARYSKLKDNGKIEQSYTNDTSREKSMRDVWNISYLNSQSKERTGYPTQKPLLLYERIIIASSKKGDIVLDPFAGCATTCVAAEKLGRKWVGIDIWDKAHEVVIDRLKKECHLESAGGGRDDLIFTEGDITYTSELPKRTDDGEIASPFLRVKETVVDDDKDGEKMSRKEMVSILLKNEGHKCQGCNREFDDARYLELDHKMPRADGGSNRIKNRVLLCSPCNKLKRHYLTLSGLRRENEKLGYMVK